MRVLLPIILSVFVFVVYGADNNEFNTFRPDSEVTRLLDRARALNTELSASFADMIHDALAVTETSTNLMADVEERFKELDNSIDLFDWKCDSVMATLERNLDKVIGRYSDLSKESEDAESEFLASVSFNFDEGVKVLNKEFDALLEELQVHRHELTNYCNAKINSCKKKVSALLYEDKYYIIRELSAQYLKSKEFLVEELNHSKQNIPKFKELLQSMDAKIILSNTFNSSFNLAWKQKTKSMYKKLKLQSDKLRQQVTELRHEASQAKCDHENALTSFHELKPKCLKIYAERYERLIYEKEKLLGASTQLSRKHCKERMRLEILLTKAQARIGCEDSKVSILTTCLDSALKSD